MSKIKQWDVSALDKKPVNQTKDSYFFTNDTDVNLVFKLTDNLQPATATVSMVNKDDESVVSEQVKVVGNKITLPLVNDNRNIVQHAGRWVLQVIYENNKDYATQWISFNIGGSVIGDRLPKLELIESYRVLETQLLDFMQNYQGELDGLHSRIDTIITTPVEGVSAQEIIDARDGEPSLGHNIRRIEDNQRLHDLDTGKAYDVLFQIKDGRPRLRMEEI